MSTKFSIVIPLFNKANYIAKTINSVLNQTYNEFELIVVDDGSTDNSYNIVKEIKDPRILLLKKENGGASSARNLGIKNSHFDYIALLDGDDLWKSNFLEEMNELIIAYSDDLFFASNFLFIKDSKALKSKVKVDIEKDKSGYLNYYKSFYKAKYSPVCSSAVVFKKELFNKFKFRENLKSGEDLFLWIQFALHNKLVYLNKEIAYYNHDVDAQNRALGKIYKKENTYRFFLDEFEEEKSNFFLKKLLDYIRTANLKPYILIYPNEVKSIISKVSSIDLKHWIFYHLPLFLIKRFYRK